MMNKFLNKIFYKVIQSEKDGNDSLNFYSIAGEYYILDHSQDCCESVYIESINGDLSNLEGAPILRADEKIVKDEESYESSTATFYTFATIKGYVDIRFNGESNGHYSESVGLYEDLHEVPADILSTYKITHPEYLI